MTAPSTIVLVGLMGSGKTTVGRLLADRLGCALIDTDGVIGDRTGLTVRQIFEQEGEAAFRRLETEVVVDALADGPPRVIAAAGGVVLIEANRRALRASGAFVVWLRADPALLVARALSQTHRPLLDNDPEATLAAMDEARRMLYTEVANAIVDIDGRTPQEVLQAVLAEVGADV